MSLILRVGITLLTQQTEEAVAFNPQKKQGGEADDDDHGVEKALAIEDKLMVGEDVDDDGTEDQQAKVAGFGDDDEDGTDEFEDLDEGHVTRGTEGSHEHRSWRAFGKFWRFSELEKANDGGHEEEQTENGGGDVSNDFHLVIRIRDEWVVEWWTVNDSQRMAPPGEDNFL